MSPLLSRLWGDKNLISICLLFAICLYFLVSTAWSVFPGRDFGTFVDYFVYFFEPDTPAKALMSLRTILSSFLITLGASNIFILNIILFCLFLASLFLFYIIGLYISIGHARIFLLIMSLNVPFMIFFHEFSSDLILQIFLIPYVAVFFLAAQSPKPRVFFILGFLTFCLVVIRPSTQLFLIAAILPFLKTGIAYRSMRLAGIFLIAFLVPACGYSLHNYLRYDTFSIARSGHVFAYRVFSQDKTFDRNNGPASESLAIAIEEHLLPKDVYRQYDVSVEDIFASGNKRMFTDLISLSDDVFGWSVNYKPLRDAAIEAAWENPTRFLEVSVMNLLAGYIRGYPSDGQAIREYPYVARNADEIEILNDSLSMSDNSENNINDQSFEERFENFRPYRHYLYSNTTAKDKSWNTEGRHRGDESLVKPWIDSIKFFQEDEIRNGSSKLGYVLRLAADKFPPIAIFVLCTLPIFFRLNQYNHRVLALLTIAALLNSAVPMVVVGAVIVYRVPYDFIFIFCGIVGLFSSDRILRLISEVLPLKTN